jgi:hypothetical protein
VETVLTQRSLDNNQKQRIVHGLLVISGLPFTMDTFVNFHMVQVLEARTTLSTVKKSSAPSTPRILAVRDLDSDSSAPVSNVYKHRTVDDDTLRKATLS